MDRLKAIFDRQKQLMIKYHPIEMSTGLLQTEDCPVDLNDRKGQARIKDFAWRFIEEVGEALDAIENTKNMKAEEFIDGLHFLVEMSILAGKDYNTITDFDPSQSEGDYLEMFYQDGTEFVMANTGRSLDKLVRQLVKELGMMCNTLKNRPWKQTLVDTNQELFNERLEKVWIVYFAILHVSGMSAYDIAETYLQKSQVNQARQESGY